MALSLFRKIGRQFVAIAQLPEQLIKTRQSQAQARMLQSPVVKKQPPLVTPRSFVKEIPSATVKVAKTGLQLFQQIALQIPARAIGSLTLSAIEEATTPFPQETGRRIFQPVTRAEKFIFGGEEIKTITQRHNEVQNALVKFGIPKSTAGS